MELEILWWCVLTPAIISLAFAVMAITLPPRIARLVSRSATGVGSPTIQAVLVTLGWCLAMLASLYARQSSRWLPDHVWPQEAWQQVLGPIGLGCLVLASIAKPASRLADARWIVAAIAITLVALCTMPSGDGWTDLLPQQRFWMAAIIASGLLNLWWLDRMARRGAENWVLWVALAGLASPAILAASAFAGLAEWVLAAVSATFVLAVIASWPRQPRQSQTPEAVAPQQQLELVQTPEPGPTHWLWCGVYPAVMFSVSAIASGRFYTYEEHSIGLYAVMLLMPSVVAVVDLPVTRCPTSRRVALALTTTLLLLGCVAWFILGGSTEEQW